MSLALLGLNLHGSGLWYVTRAAGLITLILLTVAMVLGLLNAGRFGTDRWPRFLVQGLHGNVSMVALVFLGIHVLTTVIDTYTPISLRDAVVPFESPYKTFWLGLGAIASDLLIALAVTSVLRQRLGYRMWRAVHCAAYVCWPVAVTHGLGIGTDRDRSWLLALTAACVAAVAGAGLYRVIRQLPIRGLAR